jgi:hypothetical protein
MPYSLKPSHSVQSEVADSQLSAKDPRRSRLAKVERAITVKSKAVDDLLSVIGDRETVCDAEGWLPAERRERAISRFKSDLGSWVQALRAKVADARARLELLQYQDERAELRE